jgi:hypothetical protein
VTSGYKQGSAFTQQFFYATSNQADAEYGERPMSMTTFRKPESENTDLTFTCFSSNNGGEIQTAGIIGVMTWSFSVVGVKE